MGEGVIANLVALIHDSPHEVGIGLPVFSKKEKSCRHLFLLEYVEDAWRPARIWSIVKRQREQAGMIAAPLNHVRRRHGGEFFAANVAVSGTDIQIAPAVLGTRNHFQYFAGAFEVNLITVDDSLERVGGGLRRTAEHGPDRRVFRTQTPHAKTRRPKAAGRAHLVEGSYGIEKPNRVMRIVFIVVLKHRRARRRIENNLRVGIARRNNRFLKS